MTRPTPPVLAPRAPAAASRVDSPPQAVLPALRDLAGERPIALTVRGDCMAPRLRDGDHVAVAPARRYWPGDVVAFHTPQGRIALHRLLGFRLLRGRLAYVTRGDRSAGADTPMAAGRLLGRAAVPASLGERSRAVGALLGLALRAARRRLAAFARRR
jgi:Peptidase S24-like